MSCATQFWLSEKCISDARISGGVAVMLRHLNKWLRAKGHGEQDLDEFVAVLREQGHEVREIAGTLLVMGLGSAEDLKWAERFLERSGEWIIL